jgi:pimeloyl-ACP methyl ester carboxylesterase
MACTIARDSMHNELLIKVIANDGAALSVAAVGDGEPVVFLHEFSGNHLSWASQIETLGRRYRCISYSARGYPPSQVRDTIEAYSQNRAADDAVDVMNALGIASAFVVGLSMGGFAALHVAIRNPEKVRALVIAGCGYGAKPSEQSSYSTTMNSEADHAEEIGMAAYARELANSGYASLLRAKNEKAWRLFEQQLAAHSVKGMAMTLRGVLARRPSLWDLELQLAKIRKPAMLIIGDEDLPCVEPNLFMKRTLPDCALAIMPRTGHLPNLEEPEIFNALIDRFFTAVSDESWNHIRTLMK